MALVKYAYFHEGFGSGIEHSDNIREFAEIIYPDEYVHRIHHKKIFCPLCKVGLRRTPKDKNKTKDEKDAYFAHNQSKIKCDWHTRSNKGIRYLNEESTWQAIESEELMVVTQWSTVPDEEELNGIDPVYNGVNENPYSDESTERALGRFRNGTIPHPNRVTSVRTLAIHIEHYRSMAIIMPGSDRAVKIQSLLRPLNADKFFIDDMNYLFYGRIGQFKAGYENARIDFLNIENSNNISVSIWTEREITPIRRFSLENSKDRMILVYGRLELDSGVYNVKASTLGQIAYIPKDKEVFFNLE